MLKVYGAGICGECRMFKQIMEERGFEVDYVEITESVPNMWEFLRLRDREEAFAPVRERGTIGIPAFVKEDGEITLDMNTALMWIGQEPVLQGEACGLGGCK